MGIRFFRGQKTKFEHEHRQLKEIVEVLRKEYQKEPVYLLTNVLVANGQIDCVILTRKGPIILELKAFKGEIRGMENGSWEVTTRDGPIPLPNLFLQAKIHRQDFIDRLIPICREQFPHIGENNLRRTGSWLYFCRGATYSEGQVDFRRVKWFRIVTQETLIEKMRFADSGYTLRLIDMDAIVRGLRLQEYSFESDRPVVPEPVASPKKIVISRGMVIAAVILVFVIGLLLLVMFVPGSRLAIANTYHGIAAISGSFLKSLSKETFKSESTPDDSRQALVYLNGIRIIKGIAPVPYDDRAFQLARIRAEDMARYSYLNYSNPSTGTSAESLRAQFGIDANDTVVETAYGQWSGYTLGIERQAIDSWFSDSGNSRRLLSAYDGGAIACSQGYCAFIGVIAAPAGNATASANITS